MLAAAGGRSAAARRPPPEVEDPPLASRRRRRWRVEAEDEEVRQGGANAGRGQGAARRGRHRTCGSGGRRSVVRHRGGGGQRGGVGWRSGGGEELGRFGARSIGEKSNIHLEELNQEQLDLDSLGYPKIPSTMSDDHMILVNTFEETFGNIFCEGAWNKLSKRASSNIFRSVVALASFNGGKRFFACTGFFIKWNGSTFILTSASLVRNSGDENKIVGNLVIKVALPYNQFKEGKLQHFCLQYNVAIVSVMDYNARCPANVLVHWTSSEVAAVGRCYKSGALMATTGMVVPWSGTLDCEFLLRSSCKITKAGIGGPLVTLDGDVIGMNFYDIKIGTPFLSWEVICNILESFEGKSKAGEVRNDSDSSGVPFRKMAGADKDMSNSKAGEVGKAPFCRLYNKDKLNRWPVPMPCWRHRDYVDEDKSDDDDDDVFKYTYVNGEKFEMF